MNSKTIRLKKPRKLTQTSFPSERVLFSDRLLVLYYTQYVGDIDRTEMLIKGKEHMNQPGDAATNSVAGRLREREIWEEVEAQKKTDAEMTIMTAAYKLRAWGREEGLAQTSKKVFEEIAINALKEGADPRFVARITGLDLPVILKLKAQLEDQHEDE
ncbi:MAG: hypothetical protein HRT35_17900 [Algicola sp.]|nr:hypothetical protein [Algicola sp.]